MSLRNFWSEYLDVSAAVCHFCGSWLIVFISIAAVARTEVMTRPGLDPCKQHGSNRREQVFLSVKDAGSMYGYQYFVHGYQMRRDMRVVLRATPNLRRVPTFLHECPEQSTQP